MPSSADSKNSKIIGIDDEDRPSKEEWKITKKNQNILQKKDPENHNNSKIIEIDDDKTPLQEMSNIIVLCKMIY